MEERLSRAQVVNGIEPNASRFNCRGRSRDPARSLVKKLVRICIRERVRSNTGLFQLDKDRSLAKDVEQCLIREALLMMADCLRRVNARQNCRLARCALRSALDAKARVGYRQHSLIRQRGRFVQENRQWRSVSQAIQRIMDAARAYAQTVNEQKKNRQGS